MRTFNQTAHGVEPVLKLDHTQWTVCHWWCSPRGAKLVRKMGLPASESQDIHSEHLDTVPKCSE